MKSLIILGVLATLMGGTGFMAGRYFAPEQDPVPAFATQKETLYKLPLGKFTTQVVKPTRFLNIAFKLDVFIAGASNFEKMNGGLSRTRMREDVIGHLATMVETTLWVEETDQVEIDQDELAMAVARKLYQEYPMVRSARISEFFTSRADR